MRAENKILCDWNEYQKYSRDHTEGDNNFKKRKSFG